MFQHLQQAHYDYDICKLDNVMVAKFTATVICAHDRGQRTQPLGEPVDVRDSMERPSLKG